jgi:hypothetical protein
MAVLLNRQAIARRLGVDPKTVDKIRERSRKIPGAVPFPEPVKQTRVPGVKVYRKVDIDAYARKTGRPVFPLDDEPAAEFDTANEGAIAV